MGILDTTLNIITLGGHSRLNIARAQYEIAYGHYKSLHDTASSLQTNIQQEVEHIGHIATKSFEIIRESFRIIRAGRPEKMSNYKLNSSSDCYYYNDTPKTELTLSHYASAVSVTKGVGAATTATVGSWALVSLLGTASTGASIASLTGVAATNATLAWFGGGALAAGGAGIAGGAMVLGGLIAAPLIIFSAWSTHSKADDIDKEKDKIITATNEIEPKISELKATLAVVTKQKNRLTVEYDIVYLEYKKVRKSLLPFGQLSIIWRRLRIFFGF